MIEEVSCTSFVPTEVQKTRLSQPASFKFPSFLADHFRSPNSYLTVRSRSRHLNFSAIVVYLSTMCRGRHGALCFFVLCLFQFLSSAQSQPQPPLRRQAAMTPPPPPALEPDATLTSVFNVRIPSLAQDCSHEWLDVGHSIEFWLRVETGDSQAVALSIVLAPRDDVILEKILNFDGIMCAYAVAILRDTRRNFHVP